MKAVISNIKSVSLWASLVTVMLAICFFGIQQHATSQSFPVQVNAQVMPPAPIYLGDYANANTSNSPLRVQIVLNDLTITNREVRLRVSMEGNGIRIQSNEFIPGVEQLFLEGGIPLNLTNTQLAPYFQFENITGISGMQYGEALPEGVYQFCFEVIDVLSGNRLSGQDCATTVIFQNDPPFLVAPANLTAIEERNPQNIVFQWTPRHINSSNVEYELSLVELWDNVIDYQAAFLSSPPFFQVTTRSTSYLYGPSEPLLLKDKKYAWRVQAKALQGNEEIGLFKNQGYSEIFVFGHTVQCDFPTGITHEVKGSTNVNVYWSDFSSEPTQFVVRYRELGNQNEWFFSETSGTTLTIWELRPGTNYEYQVAKRCALAESGFSPSKTFTTLVVNDQESIYDCGITPDIDIASQVPLESLEVGGQFTAGDFPVTVLEVNGGQGRFNGKGYVTIPYLRNLKVAVEFTNVFVNDQRQLAEGLVETIYDPTLSSIIDPFDWVDDVGDIIYGGDVTIYQPVDFEIEAVEIIQEDGVDKIRITGTDENGDPAEVVYNYDPGDRYQITGGETVYSIDEEGNLSEVGTQAEGGAATANNTSGVGSGGNGTSDDPSVEQIADEDVVISYAPDPDAKFGFDQVEGAYEEATYPKVEQKGGGTFYPIHKAVATGASDHFFVDVDIKKPDLTLEDLIFKTINGVAIDTEVAGPGRLRVEVRGSNGYRSEEAIVTYKTAAEDQVVVSSFFIHHLKNHQAKVQLVGVNNASVPNGTLSYLTALYASAGADLQVDVSGDYSISRSDWDLNGDGQLNYDGSGILANHPDEFRAIYNHFRQAAPNYVGDTYYVFVMGPDIQPDVALGGFMPKGSQFGFVFDEGGEGLENKGNLPEVIAHELGHGIFNLQHPFENLVDAGRTDWLMDYGGGDLLSISDWAQMGFDGLQLNWFDKDDEGAYTSSAYASKVVQLFRCANANGLPRAYPGYFGGGGSFSLGTIDLGDRRLSGVRITIKPEETIFDQVATIGRERKWTYDPYQGNQVRWEYFLDYGGVVFTRNGKEDDGPLESDLFKLQSHLFNYDLEDVRGDFEAVNNRIENKTRLTDDDIRDIKDIANCAAILFDAPTRFKIIAAIAHNTYWLREYREDLLLDLMATAPSSSYDALLRYFQQGLESHPESGPETYRILFSGVNAGNNRNRLLDELFQFWSKSSFYSEYHSSDGGNYDVDRRDEEFYREFRKEIERFIFGTPAPDCLTNTQEVTQAYDLHTCLEAATASDLMNLRLEDRKHAMRVLLEFPFSQQLGSETAVTTGGPPLFRKSLFRLVKLIPDGQKDTFMSFLKDERVYIRTQVSGLFYENTETTRMTPVMALWRYLDGDARKELLEGFVRLKSGSTSLQTELAEMSKTAESLDLATWRSKGLVLYNFDYRNILRRLWTALPLTSDDRYFTLSTDFSERTGEPLVAITQLESNGFSAETIEEELPYDPFATILFVNQSKLSQLTNFNYQVNDSERIIVPAPAILAHYAVSVGAQKTMDDIVQTTIDVGTLFIPGGQLTALGRALLYADRVSSLASIGATYTSDSDDDLSRALHNISLVTGIATLADPANFRLLLRGRAAQLADVDPTAVKNALEADARRLLENPAQLEQLDASERELLAQVFEHDRDLLRSASVGDLSTDVEAAIRLLRSVDGPADAMVRGVSFRRFAEGIPELDADEALARQAWLLFDAEDYGALQELFRARNLNGGYPPAAGFRRIDETLSGGQLSGRYFDRFQNQPALGGSFATPVEAAESVGDLRYPYESRALRDELTEGTYYFKFQFNVEAKPSFFLEEGDIMPWFRTTEQQASRQVRASIPLQQLAPHEIEEVAAMQYVRGEWRKCVVSGREVVSDVQGAINRVLSAEGQLADELVDLLNNSRELKTLFRNSTSKDRLIEVWQAVRGHGDLSRDARFIERIADFSDDLLRRLNEDLANPKWAEELLTAFRQNPSDVTLWRQLKEDPATAWEISKTNPEWQRWAQREFFKDVTRLGKRFESETALGAMKNRSSEWYGNLKTQVASDFGKDLDDYDLFSQVQLKYDGEEYFVADQVFVKFDDFGAVEDLLVIENKLQRSTVLTTPQSNALRKSSYEVRSVMKASEFNTTNQLSQGDALDFDGPIKWYKVYDSENGDVIIGIDKL